MIDPDLDVPVSQTKYATIVSDMKRWYTDALEAVGYPKFQLPIYMATLPVDVAGMSATKGRPVIWLNYLHFESDVMIGEHRMLHEVLGHELCHAYVYRYHPKANQLTHGVYWQALMVSVGLPPNPRVRPNRLWKKALDILL